MKKFICLGGAMAAPRVTLVKLAAGFTRRGVFLRYTGGRKIGRAAASEGAAPNLIKRLSGSG